MTTIAFIGILLLGPAIAAAQQDFAGQQPAIAAMGCNIPVGPHQYARWDL